MIRLPNSPAAIVKRGVRYASLGCTAYRSRGEAVCTNSLAISERKITRGLVEALRTKIVAPELIDRFVSAFEKRYNATGTKQDDGTKEIEHQLRDAERRVRNITEALALRSAGRKLWQNGSGRRNHGW